MAQTSLFELVCPMHALGAGKVYVLIRRWTYAKDTDYVPSWAGGRWACEVERRRRDTDLTREQKWGGPPQGHSAPAPLAPGADRSLLRA